MKGAEVSILLWNIQIVSRISVIAAIAVSASVGAGGDGLLRAGRPDSLVTLTVYEDLQCPDSARFRVLIDRELLPRYGDRVNFVFRDFPLPNHDWALRAAIASRFIAEKNMQLALEFRRWIMESQDQTTSVNFDRLLRWFATKNRIMTQQLDEALRNSYYQSSVVRDLRAGMLSGVQRTPTVVVDGKWFVEQIRFDEVAKAIDEALAKASREKVAKKILGR